MAQAEKDLLGAIDIAGIFLSDHLHQSDNHYFGRTSFWKTMNYNHDHDHDHAHAHDQYQNPEINFK